MSDFRDLIQDPKHRRRFEKLLYLAAKRGDADIVAERLGWGIDVNCRSPKGRTPLVANVKCYSPNAATVRVLLEHGADPNPTDQNGLTALDYARRKLAKIQSRPPRQIRKSPSLDENNQLRLSKEEQEQVDEFRRAAGSDAREMMRMYWRERLRAARRVFNDPREIEQIVEILEAVTKSE